VTLRLRRFTRFVEKLAQAQHRDQLLLRAAALAYTTLLSFVPLLTVALVTVSRVQPERAELVVRAIATVMPFSPARVQATLAALAQRTASLGWLAILISIVVTFQAFYQIEEVLNTVWGVPSSRRWQWRLASFAALLVWGPLLITALFSMLYWLSSHPWYVHVVPFTRPLPALFALVALTALYRWVPHTRVPWRAAASGAVVATLALAVVHLGFQVYLSVAADLNVIYGSLAIVLFFLMSLLVFWFAILLGAEASWVVGHAPAPPPAQDVANVVTLLLEAQRDGTVAPRRARAILGERADDELELLSTHPALVVRTRGGWQLARSAAELYVADVRARFGVASGTTLDDTASLQTLASLAKHANDSGAYRRPTAAVQEVRERPGTQGG
jgi:YihY family inner membrane protein